MYKDEESLYESNAFPDKHQKRDIIENIHVYLCLIFSVVLFMFVVSVLFIIIVFLYTGGKQVMEDRLMNTLIILGYAFFMGVIFLALANCFKK